ncbi:hypothetical protein MJO29_001270 [Puccinia striiformis f. sp. tritici]|nr:hypothetical protein MJO29_001270 [Puccinia striiformis f. sp. tritici]
MADLQTSSNPQIALVLQALENLVQRFDRRVQQQEGEKKLDLTQEERDYKTQLLDELHWNLLPAIPKQLSCLSTSLDLHHDPEKFPTPNFEQTGEILSLLAEAVFAALDCVESAALDTVPIDTQDHHLQLCKDFRCSHLLYSIAGLKNGIEYLLLACNDWIEDWKQSTRNSENDAYRTAASRSGAHLLKHMNECTQLASKIIRWTHASDFEVIQDKWEKQAEFLSPTIEVLTNITQSTRAHQNNITPLRQRVIKLAKSSALLIKLSQIFLTKISKTKPKKLLFTLDTSIDSETLYALHDRPATIAYRFERHARTLSDSFEQDLLVGGKAPIRERIKGLSFTFDTTLVFLAAYLVALPPGINYASLDTNFKAWLLEWQKLRHTATGHFNDVLDSFPDPN